MDSGSINSSEHALAAEHASDAPPLPAPQTLTHQRSGPKTFGPYQFHQPEAHAGFWTRESFPYAATRSSISLAYEGYIAANPFRPSSHANRISSEVTYDDIEASTHLVAVSHEVGSSTSDLANDSSSSIGTTQGYTANDPFHPSSHTNRVPEGLTYDDILTTPPPTQDPGASAVLPKVETDGLGSNPSARHQHRDQDLHGEPDKDKETTMDWEAQARLPLRRRPLSIMSSSTTPAESRGKNREFLLDLQYQATLLMLLHLPMLYFSRVAQIFEEADLTKEQLKYMYCQATETKLDHIYSIHKSRDFEELYPVYKNFKNSWESFVESLLKEWKTFNIISALLLGAILTLLQVPGVANDSLIKFTALMSLLCALISLIHGCMYIIRFGTMRKTYVAVEWALEAQKVRNPLWNTWTVLALPAIWLTWSILLYLVCIFSYVWRSIPTDGTMPPHVWNDHLVLTARILFSAAFGLGLVHGFFVIRTFSRWGSLTEKQWIKRVHHWKQRRAANPGIHETERTGYHSYSTVFSKARDTVAGVLETVEIPGTPPSAPAVVVQPPTPPFRESRFQTLRTYVRRGPPNATPSSERTQAGMQYNLEDGIASPPLARRRWTSLKSALKGQSTGSTAPTEMFPLSQRPPLQRRASQKSVRFSDPRVSQPIQHLPSGRSPEWTRLPRTNSRAETSDPGYQLFNVVAEADENRTEDTSRVMETIAENPPMEKSRVLPISSSPTPDGTQDGASRGEPARISPQGPHPPTATGPERTNSGRSASIQIDIVAEEDQVEEHDGQGIPHHDGIDSPSQGARGGARTNTFDEDEDNAEPRALVQMIPRSSGPDSEAQGDEEGQLEIEPGGASSTPLRLEDKGEYISLSPRNE